MLGLNWHQDLVYPRVCGGTVAMYPDAGVEKGLSPRVRGNPLYWLLSVLRVGSIPACAGEPRSIHYRSRL